MVATIGRLSVLLLLIAGRASTTNAMPFARLVQRISRRPSSTKDGNMTHSCTEYGQQQSRFSLLSLPFWGYLTTTTNNSSNSSKRRSLSSTVLSSVAEEEEVELHQQQQQQHELQETLDETDNNDNSNEEEHEESRKKIMGESVHL